MVSIRKDGSFVWDSGLTHPLIQGSPGTTPSFNGVAAKELLWN